MTDSSRRVAAPRPATLIGLAVLMALCLYAAVSVAAPSSALGATATTKLTACSGVNVRTSPTTGATRKASLKSGIKVVEVATVTGGSWKVNCTGKTVSGKTWYRISSINGKSVKSLYRVTYVYAATGLFKNPPPTAAPSSPRHRLHLRHRRSPATPRAGSTCGPAPARARPSRRPSRRTRR